MTHSCTTIYPKAGIEILQIFEKMLGYVLLFILLQDCRFTFLKETFGDLKCGIYHLFKKALIIFFLLIYEYWTYNVCIISVLCFDIMDISIWI
jgi:hypothetical protein